MMMEKFRLLDDIPSLLQHFASGKLLSARFGISFNQLGDSKLPNLQLDG